MSITSLSMIPQPQAEPAQGTADVVHVLGGGLRHELRKSSGEAALLSPVSGLVWVERETVQLERVAGRGRGAEWQPVGGHREAGSQAGRAFRELGEAAGSCRVEYQGLAGAPLKVRFRIRAGERGSYRARWRLEGMRGTLVPEALPQGLRFQTQEGFLEVDWSDVVAAHGPVVAVETEAGKAGLVFGPFELGAGQEVELDRPWPRSTTSSRRCTTTPATSRAPPMASSMRSTSMWMRMAIPRFT